MSQTTISRFLELGDIDIKRVDRRAREVTAYATFFDQEQEIRDRHGHYFEAINRSAFNRTIGHGIDRVHVIYNHGYDATGKPNMLGSVPIATPASITPDGRGLLTVSRYNDGEMADAVLAAWEGGQIRGQSFTGRVFQSRKKGRNGRLDIIERTELGLREYGPTHAPAYDGDMLVAMRAQFPGFEDLLRSMIVDIQGTPPGAPSTGDTETSLVTPADPAESHSSRNKNIARARAARMRLEQISGSTSA